MTEVTEPRTTEQGTAVLVSGRQGLLTVTLTVFVLFFMSSGHSEYPVVDFKEITNQVVRDSVFFIITLSKKL